MTHDDFGVLLFGHTRPLFITDVLRSLERQNALQFVHVWLDGHQGIPDLVAKTSLVHEAVKKFPVAAMYRHEGLLGFRKMVLQALSYAVQNFRTFLVLEDDCFPTRHAIEQFRLALNEMEHHEGTFSVYGHPFLVAAESETMTRFQGWGWGTTSEKMAPMLERLIDCYSLPEAQFLKFVDRVLTDDVLSRLDVTPPRQPSFVLRRFFAWDETLALLTALDGMVHRKTPERTIYNFGASLDSSRFKDANAFTEPPFNMVPHADIWKFF